ncbi:MAG: hypothetical protein RL311_60 [Bacteroidota bacterium]|jgi:hypothetical protein
MKKLLFLFFTLSSLSVLHGQTGIGTTTPNASAKLDVFATNKGFLPPRVTLLSATDVTTISTPATGLLVYNTGNNAGLAAGYYYWNGAVWTTIATAGGSGSVAAEFGAQFLTSNVAVTSSIPVDLITFTLPSAGTWEVISFMRAQGTAGFAAEFAVFDSSNVIVPNSEIICAFGESASTGTGIIRITTTEAAVYKLKGYASTQSFTAFTDHNGRTGVTWKKLSGNSAMTVINYGDVKTGFQSADHNGWVKLNGRAKSTLSATQQAQATALGIGTNLPNADNAFLVQNGSAVGTVAGSNTITIAQNQLPNVTYTGQIADVAHGAVIVASASGVFSRVYGSSWGNAGGGGGTETFNLSIPLNGGVTQQQLNITPKSLSVNTFIYLGY